MTWKAASFVWVLEQEKALQQVQAAVQAALPLEPHDHEDLMVLEVPVADRDAVWSLSVNHSRGFWDFGARLYLHWQTAILPLKDSSWPAIGH